MKTFKKRRQQRSRRRTRTRTMAGGNQDLIDAVKNGDVDRVTQLLAAGADVNHKTVQGFTLLTVASYFGHSEIVKLLLAKGGIGVNHALIMASHNGHTNVVRLLLEHKDIDVNHALPDGMTALLVASQNGYTEIVKLLLEHKDIDVNQWIDDGAAALLIASQYGHTEIVKLLLEHKDILVNKTLQNGYTPLIIASQKGHIAIVELLLAKGANVNQELSNGSTALYLASKNGHAEVVELLLDAGADVNQETREGESPLFIASQNGHAEIVELLLDADAEITEKVGHSVSSFTPAIRKLLNIDDNNIDDNNDSPNVCDAVFEDGWRFRWDPAFNIPYKDSFSCTLKTTDGRYVKVKVPDDHDMIVRYLNAMPKYNEHTLENGLHTWLLYSDSDPPVVKFAAVRAKNAFEVGTIHKAIALAVGATRIHGAGELLKTDKTLTYNLLSGTFTYAWLDARKKKRTCTPDELEDKIDAEFVRRFSGQRLNRIHYSMIYRDMPVYESDLEEYKAAGFEVQVFESQDTCKASKGGRRR